MKSKIVLLAFLSLVLSQSYAQIPLYKSRSSLSNISSVRDSAQKSITLLPNFSWVPSSGITYQTVITEGDLTLDWPKKNQIFQRDNSNKGWVYVKGNCTNMSVDSVEISASVVQGGQGKVKNIPVDAYGFFEGAIQLDGGDYSIEVSEFYANSGPKLNAVKKVISRVGVGEVLMVWGHSFMEGDGISQPASDPRSRTIKNVFRFDPPNSYFQDLSLLPFSFEQINTDMGPFNSTSWIFGALADTLVNRLNVPVLIYSAAFGGSRVIQNKQNISNEPFNEPWFGSFESYGFPFRAVQAVTQRFVPQTGIRGVIVHHGINDNTYSSQLQSNYEYVIDYIRNTEVGFSNMPFFLAFEMSNFTAINSAIQNIVDNDVNIYPGIDLRQSFTIGPWRENDDGYCGYGCGHFRGTYGLQKYLEFWKDVIPNSFFSTSPFKEAVISGSLKY